MSESVRDSCVVEVSSAEDTLACRPPEALSPVDEPSLVEGCRVALLCGVSLLSTLYQYLADLVQEIRGTYSTT
jgi:hypothetical protein